MIFHFLCEMFVLKHFYILFTILSFLVYYYLIKVCPTISLMLYVNKIHVNIKYIFFINLFIFIYKTHLNFILVNHFTYSFQNLTLVFRSFTNLVFM